jgi:hypothetical protein
MSVCHFVGEIYLGLSERKHHAGDNGLSGFMISTHHQYYSGYKLKLRLAVNRSVVLTTRICIQLATDRRYGVGFPIPNFTQMGQVVRSARVRVHLLT